MDDALNPLTGRPVGTVPLEEVLGQPGSAFLEGISNGRYPMPPIAAVIPAAPVEIEVGRVVFRAVPEERFYNPIGSVHGGYASTLLDTAMACAVHSMLEAGEGYTSLEIKIAFHKAITRDTGELRSEGRVLSRGSRVAAAEGRLTGILTDGDLRRLFGQIDQPLDLPVTEAMTHSPKMTRPQVRALDALLLMEEHSITVLPVVDDTGRPMAALHMHELVRAGLSPAHAAAPQGTADG